MRKLLFVISCLIYFVAQSQQNKLVVYYDTTNLNMHLDYCKTKGYFFNESSKDSILKTTEKYIDSAHLYSKAKVSLLYLTHARINRVYYKYRNPSEPSIVSSIQNDLELALQYDTTNQFCIKKEIALLTKSTNDINAIKKLGYKSAYTAMGGHLSVIQAYTTSLAFDVSFSMFAPRYKIPLAIGKRKCSECSRLIPFSISSPSVGYEWNVTNGTRGFRVSMFEVNSIIHIVPLQFVFLKSNSGLRSGILRPEIGFGFGRFSLSYAYNLFFGKNFDMREKNLVTLKFDFPIDKWYETEF